MADTISVRNAILTSDLAEQPVTIPGWDKDAQGNPFHLFIRELDGKTGTELLASCSDASAGTVNQEALAAGVILATLRNADDPNKALVFSPDPVNQPNSYDPAYRDSLMSRGLGKIMQAAMASIALSGLDVATASGQAKNA